MKIILDTIRLIMRVSLQGGFEDDFNTLPEANSFDFLDTIKRKELWMDTNFGDMGTARRWHPNEKFREITINS